MFCLVALLPRNLVKVVDAVGGIRTIYLKAFEHYLVSLQDGAFCTALLQFAGAYIALGLTLVTLPCKLQWNSQG